MTKRRKHPKRRGSARYVRTYRVEPSAPPRSLVDEPLDLDLPSAVEPDPPVYSTPPWEPLPAADAGAPKRSTPPLPDWFPF